MHEEVRSPLHIKPLSSIRLTSVAGQGLPERMRSTVFAFLGLTAAAGLVLVAAFAQLGLPLPSAAPMTSDPAKLNAVAEAVAVEKAPRAVPARGRRGSAPPQVRPNGESSVGVFAQPAPEATDPAAVEPPAPIPPDPAPDASGVNGGRTEAPSPPPAPTPSAVPNSSAPTPTPVPAPVPVASPPPEAAPPALPAGPGNSSSAAAAANASPRGIEASNGKAHGHSK
jgi:hypothetical protein